MTSLPDPNTAPPTAPNGNASNSTTSGNDAANPYQQHAPFAPVPVPPAASGTPSPSAGPDGLHTQAPGNGAAAFPTAPAPVPPANAPQAPAAASNGGFPPAQGAAAPLPPVNGGPAFPPVPGAPAAPGAPAYGGGPAHGAAKQPFTAQRLLPITPFDIVTYAGALLLIVSCALPFVTLSLPFTSSSSFNLFQGIDGQGADGWVFLVLALVAAAFSVFKLYLGTMIVSALTTVLAIIEVAHTSSKIKELTDAYGSLANFFSDSNDYLRLDAGAYLLIISSLAMLAGAVVSFVLQLRAKKTGIPVKGFGGTGATALNPGGRPVPGFGPQTPAAGTAVPFGAPAPGAPAPANGQAPVPPFGAAPAPMPGATASTFGAPGVPSNGENQFGAPAPTSNGQQSPFGASATVPAPSAVSPTQPDGGAPFGAAASGAPATSASGALAFTAEASANSTATFGAPTPAGDGVSPAFGAQAEPAAPATPAANPYVGSYTPSVPGASGDGATSFATAPDANAEDDGDDDLDSTVLSTTPRAVPGPVFPNAPAPAAVPASAPSTGYAAPAAPSTDPDDDDDLDSTVLSSSHTPTQYRQ